MADKLLKRLLMSPRVLPPNDEQGDSSKDFEIDTVSVTEHADAVLQLPLPLPDYAP